MPVRHLARLSLMLLLGAHVLVHGLACSDDDPDEQGVQAGAAGTVGETIDESDLRY